MMREGNVMVWGKKKLLISKMSSLDYFRFEYDDFVGFEYILRIQKL